MSIETHPVQSHQCKRNSVLPKTVTMRAYEVYCHVYGKQDALVSGDCRGGFSVSEIIAFLYAHSFPKEEWSVRVKESFNGTEGL